MVAKIAADQIIKKWLAPALAGGAAATQSEDADAVFASLGAKGANILGAKAAHGVFKQHMDETPSIFTNFDDLIESGRHQAAASREAGNSRQPWFIGADNKPRYEINDSNASLNSLYDKRYSKTLSERLQNDYYGEGKDHVGTSMIDMVRHNPMYRAYPDMADMSVYLWRPNSWLLGDSPAAYTRPRDGHPMGEMHLNTGYMAETGRGESLRSLLHESQHAIQDREGLARGASEATSIDDIQSYIRNPQKHSAMSLLPTGDDPWKVYEDIVENKMTQLGRILDASRSSHSLPDDDPMKEAHRYATDRLGYMSSAGEAEARAVEARLRMLAGDRMSPNMHPYNDMRMPKAEAEFYFGEGKQGPTLFEMIEMMTREAQ
jgi:hypothetical protein